MLTTECPLCQGQGLIHLSKEETEIHALRQRGLTIRQIAKVVGKSPTAVHYHLNKYEKKRKGGE